MNAPVVVPDFDLAAQRAALEPARPALQWRGVWLDWAALDARASALAGRLAAAGLEPGDRVALLSPNRLAHIDLFLATAKLGVVAAPLDPRLSAAELGALAARLRPAALLVAPGLAAREGAVRAELTGPALARELDGYDVWLEGAPPPPAAPTPAPEAPQMLLATGGSGGAPKLAVLPYRQIAFNAAATALAWDVGAADCAVHATPCAHAGFHALLTPLLAAGGRVVLHERFDPADYLETVARERATLAFLVPTMVKMLAEHPAFPGAELGSLRWAIAGGAPLPSGVRAAWAPAGVPLRQGYGLTEAGVNCFAITADDAGRAPESVGVPMLGTRAAVLRDDGRACDPGEVGELVLSGPHLFGGYFGDPDATAAALREGRLHTGDLAERGAGGNFRIRGRRREMYISGGFNVYPSEVEDALARHPEVAACAVLGVPDPHWGETGLAVIAPRAGRAPDPDAVRAFLRERLAGYKVPRHVVVVDHLPLTPAGKIAKPTLRAAFDRGDLERRTPDATP